MESHRYRVVLTGELHPGFSSDAAIRALAEVFQAPESTLRGVFDGAERPVQQSMSAEDALELQGRLERVGVRSRVEKESGAAPIELKLRETGGQATSEVLTAPITEAGMMECPACGHRQLVSNRCESCGIVFAEYRRNKAASAKPKAPGEHRQEPPRPAAAPEQRASAPEPRAPAPAQPRSPQEVWGNDWLDADDDNEPDERHYLALFFGPPPERYLDACSSYLAGPRTRFRLGWNWGAVFSPFVWSLYRKMWGWSLVMFLTEIFLPVLLIVLGSYGVVSERLVHIGYAVMLANRLFWPALANYLYCRYARNTLQRMHMMSPNYATEIDIATAGGVSTSSVLVGLAVAAVMSVFLWSVVDSMHESAQLAHLPRALDLTESADLDDPGRPRRNDVTGITGTEVPLENKWVATRRMLRFIGQKANAWLVEHPGSEPSQLSIFRLREDYSLSPDTLRDAWGSDIQFIPDNEGYRLISSGPDRLFGTADDIQYRRVLGEATL